MALSVLFLAGHKGGMKDSPEEMTRRLERIINNLIQLASENRK